MLRAAEFVLDQTDIECQFGGELGLELADLQFDDDVAQLLDVEKQQVDRELFAVHCECHLRPTKLKPAPSSLRVCWILSTSGCSSSRSA